MALALAAGGLAAAAYLDGKYQLRRDLTTLGRMKIVQREWERLVAQDKVSPWYKLADVCAKQPNVRAIWTRERSWTFGELHDQTARYAQWMIEQGVRPGDLVALYLHNSAEFLMLSFATLCIGAGPACINYNLEGGALMHCVNVSAAKLLIVDPDNGCQARIEGSRSQIEAAGITIYTLDSAMKQNVSSRAVIVPEDSWRAGMKGTWPLFLVYTSGTTGLPKGAPYTLARMYLTGTTTYPMYGSKPGEDFWYSPMPLYHGTGGISSATLLLAGVGVAIPPRFSVSTFWPDVCASGSTGFIYVGETARYLLNAPPHPLERSHKLRIAYGNGLRPDVWARLQERFNIPEVGEFFNSSEGVFVMSVWAKNGYLRGSVGHHGLIFRAMLRNYYIPVRIDHETGDIWRDPKTGFAQRMSYDEGGEMIVAVAGREAFDGYWRNPEATNKRFATDVFKKGDLYYRSGDALRRNPDGHWFFLDRLGDTFRWKSENVSTAEVSQALGRFAGIAEANVYGVTVPGHEGRAGCAAISLASGDTSSVDYSELLRYSRAQLPRYAVPLFLRVVRNQSHIHNHKQNKVGLRKEGVDPNLIGTEEASGKDDMFLWLKPGSENKDTYVPFTNADWDKLVRGQVRL